MSEWQPYAEGVDKYGRPWVLEDRMHPDDPEIESRGRILIDGEWVIMTPAEFEEWECISGVAAG